MSFLMWYIVADLIVVALIVGFLFFFKRAHLLAYVSILKHTLVSRKRRHPKSKDGLTKWIYVEFTGRDSVDYFGRVMVDKDLNILCVNHLFDSSLNDLSDEQIEDLKGELQEAVYKREPLMSKVGRTLSSVWSAI